MRVILIFRSDNDREVSPRETTQREKVRELQTRLHQHLILCACSRSLSLVGLLSLSQLEEALDADPGFIFILNNDAAIGACLGAAGCPVAVAAAVPPPSNTDRLAQWIKSIVMAEVTCVARDITPDIVLVRAPHVPFNPQHTGNYT